MIQIIKYNKPNVNGRIYTKNSFINLDEIKNGRLFIERESVDSSVIDLNNIIFSSKVIENEHGVFLTDLNFIESKDNKLFFKHFLEYKKVCIYSKSLGEVDIQTMVIKNTELISVAISKDIDLDFKYDFTYCTNEPKLILEFEPKPIEDRYGKKYIIKNPKFPWME